MTNEEREALIAQGWMPPVAVDPDIAEAKKLSDYYADINDYQVPVAWFVNAIQRGRALASAEAKPGLVWKRYEGSGECPVPETSWVTIRYVEGLMVGYITGIARHREWPNVTHYAIITQPEDK